MMSRRTLAGGSALLLSVGLMAGPSAAQAENLPAPPRANVKVTHDAVHVPATLRSQRYRFVVRTPHRLGVELLLMRPDRGYTKREFARDGRLADRGRIGAIRRISDNVRFFGGATADPDHDGVFWQTLYPGRYWAMNFAATQQRAGDIETIRVHGPTRATSWPGQDTRITTRDFGFTGPRVLPRSGRMLIRNRMGSQPHFIVLARLTRDTTYADVVAWLENPQGPPPPVRFQMSTPIMSGDVQNLVRYRVPRGTYALMCFFPNLHGQHSGQPHAFTGMHRKVTVR